MCITLIVTHRSGTYTQKLFPVEMHNEKSAKISDLYVGPGGALFSKTRVGSSILALFTVLWVAIYNVKTQTSIAVKIKA